MRSKQTAVKPTIEELSSRIRNQDEIISNLRNELSIREHQLERLNKLISEIVPLRKHVKRQLKNRMQNLDKYVESKLARPTLHQPEEVIFGKNADLSTLMSQAYVSDKLNLASYISSRDASIKHKAYLRIRSVIKRNI